MTKVKKGTRFGGEETPTSRSPDPPHVRELRVHTAPRTRTHTTTYSPVYGGGPHHLGEVIYIPYYAIPCAAVMRTVRSGMKTSVTASRARSATWSSRHFISSIFIPSSTLWGHLFLRDTGGTAGEVGRQVFAKVWSTEYTRSPESSFSRSQTSFRVP